MANSSDAIYVNDPIYIEEIAVSRGDIDDRDGPFQMLYLQKYDDDTAYAVMDQTGRILPGVRFHGDPTSDIEKVKNLFDLVFDDWTKDA